MGWVPLPRSFPISWYCKLDTGMQEPNLHPELQMQRESYLPVFELEFRNCFRVQKTEFCHRPLQIALPAVAYLNIHILK